MKKVLLALGEENFSALFRKEFDTYEHPSITFDVLSDEVLSRNFLESLTKMYTPEYVVIHDTFLSTTAKTPKERDDEILQILKAIRLQSAARIVYICQRDNADFFLSQLVALGIYDIFNEQAINAVKFMNQVAEPAKLSNVLKWTDELSEIQAFDVKATTEPVEPAAEDSKSVKKPKKSILSQIKKLSPFKASPAAILPADDSIPSESQETELFADADNLELTPVVKTVEVEMVDEETFDRAQKVYEDESTAHGPFIEPVQAIPVEESTPRPVHVVSVEDIFGESVQPMPIVQTIEPIPMPSPTPTPSPTPVEPEVIKKEPVPVEEEPAVFPSMPSTVEEDFLLSKTQPVDTFDVFTERIDDKHTTNTEMVRTAPGIEPTEPTPAQTIETTVPNPASSPQIEEQIATLGTLNQWQSFLNANEPFQARGQYATVYAIGHLARDYSTTQFALNCAVLLREQYTKVAFVELNQNLNLEYVQAFATGTQPFANEDFYFEAHGITHFKFKVGLPLQEILQRFDAVVLDLGMISNLHPYKSYFERSNYRLLLTPTYQWSWHLVDTFIHYDQHALMDYQFVMFNAAKHDVMNFKRIYGNRVQLHALDNISRIYDLSDDEKQAIRPLIGLKKGSRLKKNMVIK